MPVLTDLTAGDEPGAGGGRRAVAGSGRPGRRRRRRPQNAWSTSSVTTATCRSTCRRSTTSTGCRGGSRPSSPWSMRNPGAADRALRHRGRDPAAAAGRGRGGQRLVSTRLPYRPGGGGDGRRHRRVPGPRLRARAGRDRGAGHDVPRRRLPVRQLGVERAVRAAGGRRTVGGARPDVRGPARPRRPARRRAGGRGACSGWPSPSWGDHDRRRGGRPAAGAGPDASASTADVAAAQRDLVTYLLRFFVPQVLLYAAGTIATAVLYAKRRFADHGGGAHRQHRGHGGVPGPVPGRGRARSRPRPHDRREAAARGGGDRRRGGVRGRAAGGRARRPASGCGRAGPGATRRSRRVLRHSGWGVVLHTGAGLLLGAAIVTAAGVAGGVVAYQVGWVIFLAPYAVLAQPIHTAILPEMVDRGAGGRAPAGGRLPALGAGAHGTAGATGDGGDDRPGLAGPAGRGRSARPTAKLLAAAVAGLAVGLYAYSAFLLLARGYYALGDSRTPGVVSLVSAAVGVVVMAVSAALVDGTARIVLLGLGHSAAYTVGAVSWRVDWPGAPAPRCGRRPSAGSVWCRRSSASAGGPPARRAARRRSRPAGRPGDGAGHRRRRRRRRGRRLPVAGRAGRAEHPSGGRRPGGASRVGRVADAHGYWRE